MAKQDGTPEKRKANTRFEFGQSTRRTFISRLGMASLLATTAPVASALGQTLGKEPASPEAKDAIPVTLRINGKEHDLRIDPRTTLLDCLRETSASHRHEEGLRPRPVRRLHGARQRPARELLPEPGR